MKTATLGTGTRLVPKAQWGCVWSSTPQALWGKAFGAGVPSFLRRSERRATYSAEIPSPLPSNRSDWRSPDSGFFVVVADFAVLHEVEALDLFLGAGAQANDGLDDEGKDSGTKDSQGHSDNDGFELFQP